MERTKHILVALIAVTFGLFGADVFGVIGAPIQDLAGESPAPYVVPKSGDLRGLAYDGWRNRVYLSNKTLNQVETYDLNTETWLAPVYVGSLPEGLDITPDGSKLYVLNTGAANVSVVDLAVGTPAEVERIPLPGVAPGGGGDAGVKWKFSNDGTAFFSVSTGAYHFDPVTRSVTVPPLQTQHITRSWDGNSMIFGRLNEATVYDATAGTFETIETLTGFSVNWWDWTVAIAITNDQSLRAATRNGFTRFFDRDWNIVSTIPGATNVDDNWDGLLFGPRDDILYRAVSTGGNQVEKIDVDSMLVADSIPLPERLTMRSGGDIKMNWTGDYLYAISQSGLMIIPTGEPPIPEPTTLALLVLGGVAMIRRRR